MKRFAGLSFAVPLLAVGLLAQTESQRSSPGSTSTTVEQGSTTGSTKTTTTTRSEQRDNKWMSGERKTWKGVLVDSGCMAHQQAPAMSSSRYMHGQQTPDSAHHMSPSGTMHPPEHTITRESTTDPAAQVSGTQTGVQRSSDVTARTGKAIVAFDPTTGRIDPSCAINANTSAYSLLLDDGRLMRLNTSESATARNNISTYARQARGETEKVEVSGVLDSGMIQVRSARPK